MGRGEGKDGECGGGGWGGPLRVENDPGKQRQWGLLCSDREPLVILFYGTIHSGGVYMTYCTLAHAGCPPHRE